MQVPHLNRGGRSPSLGADVTNETTSQQLTNVGELGTATVTLFSPLAQRLTLESQQRYCSLKPNEKFTMMPLSCEIVSLGCIRWEKWCVFSACLSKVWAKASLSRECCKVPRKSVPVLGSTT